MPGLSLGTFSPTHFFHPLLRATHSIEPQEGEAIPGNKLSQQGLENCPGQTNYGILSVSLPNKKAFRLARRWCTVLTSLKPTIKGIDNHIQHYGLGGARSSFLLGYDVLFLCLSPSAPVLGVTHKLSPV